MNKHYKINISSKVASVSWKNKDDAIYVRKHAGDIVDDIFNTSKYPITSKRYMMILELKFHVVLYLFGERARSNPADLELTGNFLAIHLKKYLN